MSSYVLLLFDTLTSHRLLSTVLPAKATATCFTLLVGSSYHHYIHCNYRSHYPQNGNRAMYNARHDLQRWSSAELARLSLRLQGKTKRIGTSLDLPHLDDLKIIRKWRQPWLVLIRKVFDIVMCRRACSKGIVVFEPATLGWQTYSKFQ